MGRQVGLYLLPEDSQQLVEAVLANPNVVMLGYPSPTPAPRRIEALPLKGDPTLFIGVYFWNTKFPFEVSKWIRIEQGPATGWYGFSSDEAPVIEFDPSRLLLDGSLARGRLWMEHTFWRGEERVYKGEDFEKWYDSIRHWVKKHFVLIDRSPPPAYIGPAAHRWHEQRGILK
jgi:hypothetical protein